MAETCLRHPLLRFHLPMSLSVLHSCASCAERTGATLWCARCRTDYCSRVCQKAHWTSGGHKKDCKVIARARRDTNPEVQSRALARASCMSGGAPHDARCMFCLDWGDAKDPLARGCACRGSFGWTHVTCLVKPAETARAPPPGEPYFTAWVSCSTCKQEFTGLVKLRLAIALWAKYARAVEPNQLRVLAACSYAAALGAAGEHAEAVRLRRGILDDRTRVADPEHRGTLDCASKLARSLLLHGECAEAAVLLRMTLAVETRTAGPDDEGTLFTEGLLVKVLLSLGKYAETEALCRGALEKMRRVFGRDHGDTLTTSGKKKRRSFSN